MDIGEEIPIKEESLMDVVEMDRDRYLEDRDMEEMIDRGMMDIGLGIVISLGEGRILEVDRSPEAEKGSDEIDRERQTGLQTSLGALDVNARLVSR